VANIPIDAYETLPVGSLIGEVSTNQLSGEYEGTVTLSNDLNPGDPDKTLHLTYRVYAPSILTVNTADTINAGENISIANADVEAHEGALRAASQIISQSISDGFFINGIHVGDVIDAGEELIGTVGFDPTG